MHPGFAAHALQHAAISSAGVEPVTLTDLAQAPEFQSMLFRKVQLPLRGVGTLRLALHTPSRLMDGPVPATGRSLSEAGTETAMAHSNGTDSSNSSSSGGSLRGASRNPVECPATSGRIMAMGRVHVGAAAESADVLLPAGSQWLPHARSPQG